MTILFWLSVLAISYVYIGYLATLKLFTVLTSRNDKLANARFTSELIPIVSVIGAAYNEKRVMGQRIENLLTLDYPKDKLEIIIASDGSTDKTVEIAKMYENQGVKVLDFKVNRGRAAIQSDAVKVSKGSIVVFTDADTKFETDFLKKVIRNFADSKIGGVVGKLVYRAKGDAISESEALYWKHELKIRGLESRLEILAIGSGACLAVRKELFRPLEDAEDIDFTSTLDIVLQGYRVIYESEAVAYDEPPSSPRSEFDARVRMTSKNFVGTLRKWGLANWFKHPAISFGLLSHRILRWLTPYFMLIAFVSNIFLLNQGGFYRVAFFGQIAFYLASLVGWIGESKGVRLSISSTIFSFCVANLGMMVGVAKGIFGRAPASYKVRD